MRLRTSARPLLAGALAVSMAGVAAVHAGAQPTAPAKAQISVHKRTLHVRTGDRAAVRGLVRPGVAGLRVALQVRDGGRWRTLDRARTRTSGRYALRDRPPTALSARMRVRVRGARGVRGDVHRVGRLNVYRFANASWYGPGLYGNRLGCGGTLGAGRLGVAHKTLPCGTRVTLRHRGRTVRVPVIDRGPYVAGREYDLTAATARKLRFTGDGAILVTH
jgi:hypothetical protein